MVGPGGVCGIRQDTEIRSMSGRYASYWNAFLFTNNGHFLDLYLNHKILNFV